MLPNYFHFDRKPRHDSQSRKHSGATPSDARNIPWRRTAYACCQQILNRRMRFTFWGLVQAGVNAQIASCVNICCVFSELHHSHVFSYYCACVGCVPRPVLFTTEAPKSQASTWATPPSHNRQSPPGTEQSSLDHVQEVGQRIRAASSCRFRRYQCDHSRRSRYSEGLA